MTNHLPFHRRVFNCVIWHASICVVSLYAVCCTEEKPQGEYPVIDVANDVVSNNYQRAYCSDFFSSIELIPLETKQECLINSSIVAVNDSFIFIVGERQLYVFDRSGNFLNQIGEIGRGPGEYTSAADFFFNNDGATVFVENYTQILEYKFDGKFIRSIRKPEPDDPLTNCLYVGDNIFVGSVRYDGNNEYKYCLFDGNGDIIEFFPNYIFFNRIRQFASRDDLALQPVRIYNQIYLKDYVNDTIYVLADSKLEPAYVFDLGKYSYPKELLEGVGLGVPGMNIPYNIFWFTPRFVGSTKYFFYELWVPKVLPRPKGKLKYCKIRHQYFPDDILIFGIFDREQNVNLLLDTDQHHQRGIINDIDGGLPIFPRYYAGDGVVVDIWEAEEMKEMLTEEYFSKQTIKDRQAHQKLKEVLKNLDEEDNPVVVIAKLK